MKSYTICAFAVPINYGSLGEDTRELNKVLVQDIFHYMENENTQARSGVGVKQTHLGLEHSYTSFETLGSVISKYMSHFVKWSGVHTENIKVKEFWGNVNKDPSAFHMPHSHGLRTAMFTGVYFPSSGIENGVNISDSQNLNDDPEIISLTQPNPGDLVLLDPLEFVKTSMVTPRTDKFPFFGNPICVPPRESTLIIFPSYLSHMVTPTKKENFTRISIAFNVEV